MVDWRGRLRTGRFRGIPFRYENQEIEGGRRVQAVGIPASEYHVAEDLGRVHDSFEITAYLVGDFVTQQRDALIAALNRPGPGTLSRAMWPDRQVHTTSYTVVENKKKLGYCEIRMSFVEASRLALPSAKADTGAALVSAVNGTAGASLAAFVPAWNVAGLASGTAEAAIGQVAAVADALSALIPVGAITLSVANFRDAVGVLADAPAALLADPLRLGSAISTAFQAYCSAECETGRAEETLGSLAVFTVPGPKETGSAVGQGEAANATALIRLVRQSALIERARVARVVPLASRDQARTLEGRLVADISDDALTVADAAGTSANPDVLDAVFRSLNALKAAVVNNLEARAASLAPLVDYTISGPVPAVALAYALYGTIGSGGARADELAARNGAIHPGFLPEMGQALAS